MCSARAQIKLVIACLVLSWPVSSVLSVTPGPGSHPHPMWGDQGLLRGRGADVTNYTPGVKIVAGQARGRGGDDHCDDVTGCHCFVPPCHHPGPTLSTDQGAILDVR